MAHTDQQCAVFDSRLLLGKVEPVTRKMLCSSAIEVWKMMDSSVS
ncbi:hypothetical protein SynBIOSU31_02656 [Synechococcus sp. BIOS-U3-1]|nr:hypothetical protein SynBIOSU31_02656 [Synechococcus sp. BIOS-U3-1]